MESLLLPPNNVATNSRFMTPFSTHLRSSFKLFFSLPLTSLAHSAHPSPAQLRSQSRSVESIAETQPLPVSKRAGSRGKVLSQAQLRQNWLDSLSFPCLPKSDVVSEECCLSSDDVDAGSAWVIGVDPDASGALAVLKPDSSVHVFDSPHLKVLVGKRLRKRLDARSIVQLIQSFDAPKGTTAYIEQSLPFPKDGKQGWWSGGFGYGLWIGSFVASGYTVVPVSSLAWKNEYKLSGSNSSKDDSRKVASSIFPSMSTLLQRKKDHGRAEALLIAAYGKGLKLTCSSPLLADDESL